MLPSLSPEQRKEVNRYGGLIPVWDEASGLAYLMLPVLVESHAHTGDVSAGLPSFGIYGNGDTAEEAIESLAISAITSMNLFGVDLEAESSG